MARGKFNFLNVSKLSAEDHAHYAQLCGGEFPSAVYANNSHEWFAAKIRPGMYRVVSFSTMRDSGFENAAGLANNLRGVREVVEILHNEREDQKRSNPWF